MTTETKNGPLFAVAYNHLIRGRWRPGRIEHINAPDAATAKRIFIGGHREPVDIIGVAPVVGYFVQDEKKNILTTE